MVTTGIRVLFLTLLPSGLVAQTFADVAVIFSENCLACHSSAAKMGGLVLDGYESTLKGGAHGPAVIPGKSKESRMVAMLEGRITPQMPQGGKLSARQIAVVKAWIDAGAKGAGEVVRGASLPAIQTTVPVTSQVAAVAYSPDGRLVAVGSYQEVAIMEAASGRRVAKLTGHMDVVRALAFSPDGRVLAAAGGAPARVGQVKLWDMTDPATPKLVREWLGHEDCIYAAAFQKDGKTLATGSYDKLIQLWDTATGTPLRKLRDHVDAVYALAFSPDGTRLASGSADRTVKIWNPATGERLYTLSDATDGVQALSFHPGGKQIAAAGADKTIRIWDLSGGGGTLARSIAGHEDTILQIAYSPDGSKLLTSASDRTIKLWNAATLVEEHSAVQPDWALSVAYAPDGRAFVVGRYDGTVGFYEATGVERR